MLLIGIIKELTYSDMLRKKHILKPLALVLAFIVGLSSMGLSMDKHVCQGKVKSVAFFGKAKTCLQMQSDTETSGTCRMHRHCRHSGKKTKPCCHNESKYSKLSLRVAWGTVAISHFAWEDYAPGWVWVAPFYSSWSFLSRNYLSAHPPRYLVASLTRDIYALFENFRL